MSGIVRYDLKQETPMIHFQWAEPGATLRASEVKPKLDSFIIDKLGGICPDDFYQNVRKNKALDYKVSFKANGKCIKSDSYNKKEAKNPINPMYFGNMGNTESKETVFYEGLISMTVICLKPGLMETIDKYLYEFFLVTNFGTRQSKGFGSFTLVKKDGKDIQRNPQTFLDSVGTNYIYTVTKLDFTHKLNIAGTVCAVMKGGINRRGYIKGFIQREYLDELGMRDTGSDKAMIKSKLLRDNRVRAKEDHKKYTKFVFIRPILGFADKYLFRDDYRKGTVNVESEQIKRFKSPVTVSVSGDYIFFIMNDSYKDILGKNFEFSANGQREQLKTIENFDGKDFFDKFIPYFKKNQSELNKIGNPFRDAANIELKRGGEKK